MIDVESQVIAIVAKQASVEPAEVTRQTRIEDLEMESLDVIEIIFAVEELFDITVPYNANEAGAAGVDFDTVDGVVSAVEALVAERRAAG